MKFDSLASKQIIEKTIRALATNNIEGLLVEDEAAALAKIKELIPQGASVHNGSSRTLEQIGYIEYLKSGQHDWNNFHEGIVKEKDPVKQKALRKQAALSDYYLGSVHALAETGEFLIASNTGSQLPNIVFGSDNLIFVVGAQKIVPTLTEGSQRLEEYVVPLEEVHMQQKYGVGTHISKVLLFKYESRTTGRKVRIIIVNKVLGF